MTDETLWQMIKSLTLLMERLEGIGDRFYELLERTEIIFNEQRGAVIEQYIRQQLKERQKQQ